MEKGTQLKFAVLCLVPFIMVLGNSMLIPVLPSIKSALDITQLEVGLLITAFHAGWFGYPFCRYLV